MITDNTCDYGLYVRSWVMYMAGVGIRQNDILSVELQSCEVEDCGPGTLYFLRMLEI